MLAEILDGFADAEFIVVSGEGDDDAAVGDGLQDGFAGDTASLGLEEDEVHGREDDAQCGGRAGIPDGEFVIGAPRLAQMG